MQSESDDLRDFRRELLWRFGKYVLHDEDLAWARDHLASLRRVSVDPMFPVLRYVWNHLSRNTRRLADELPELEPLAEAVQRYCAFHEEAHARTVAAQDELLAELHGEGVGPLAIKGAAMRSWTDVSQAMTDLDLLARDLDEAWAVIGVSDGLGYLMKTIKVRRVSPLVSAAGGVHGYTNLYRCEGGRPYTQGDWDLGRVRTLDLHLGRFYGPGEGVMVTDLWAGATTREVAGTPVLVPAREDMLLVEMLHLVRHGTLSIGTLNRVCQLLDAPLDRDRVAEELARNDLLWIAHAALLAVEESFPHAAASARELRARLAPAPSWLVPAITTVARARRVERYGAGSPASVTLQSLYLLDTERHQSGRRVPVGAGAGALRMFRARHVYPRAHTRFDERRLGWLSPASTAVMLRRLDTTAWSPRDGWRGADRAAVEPGVPCTAVGSHTLLVDRGRTTEVVLTPVGAFTSARYDGGLDPHVEAACRARVAEARHRLCPPLQAADPGSDAPKQTTTPTEATHG